MFVVSLLYNSKRTAQSILPLPFDWKWYLIPVHWIKKKKTERDRKTKVFSYILNRSPAQTIYFLMNTTRSCEILVLRVKVTNRLCTVTQQIHGYVYPYRTIVSLCSYVTQIWQISKPCWSNIFKWCCVAVYRNESSLHRKWVLPFKVVTNLWPYWKADSRTNKADIIMISFELSDYPLILFIHAAYISDRYIRWLVKTCKWTASSNALVITVLLK